MISHKRLNLSGVFSSINQIVSFETISVQSKYLSYHYKKAIDIYQQG